MAEKSNVNNLDKYDLAVKKTSSAFSRSIKENRKLMEDSSKSGGMSNEKQRVFNQHLLRTSLLSKEYLNVQKQINRELDAIVKKQAELAKQSGPSVAIKKAENQARITELEEKKAKIKAESSSFSRERRNVVKEFKNVPKTGKEDDSEPKEPKNRKTGFAGIGAMVGGVAGPEGASAGGVIGAVADAAIAAINTTMATSRAIAKEQAPLTQQGYNGEAIKRAGWANHISAAESLGLTKAYSQYGGVTSADNITQMSKFGKGMGVDLNKVGAFAGGMGGFMKTGDRGNNASVSILANAVKQGVNKSDLQTYMGNMETMTSDLAGSLPSISNEFTSTMADLQRRMTTGTGGFSMKSAAGAATSFIGKAQDTSTSVGSMVQLFGTKFGQGAEAMIGQINKLLELHPGDKTLMGYKTSLQNDGGAVNQQQVSKEMSGAYMVDLIDITKTAMEKSMPGVAKVMINAMSTARDAASQRTYWEGAGEGKSNANSLLNTKAAAQAIDTSWDKYKQSMDYQIAGIDTLVEKTQDLITNQVFDKFGGSIDKVVTALNDFETWADKELGHKSSKTGLSQAIEDIKNGKGGPSDKATYGLLDFKGSKEDQKHPFGMAGDLAGALTESLKGLFTGKNVKMLQNANTYNISFANLEDYNKWQSQQNKEINAALEKQ